MSNIRARIKTLEKLSLITCSNEVLPLLERTLENVAPILKVDTRNTAPLLWQNVLAMERLHNDRVQVRLDTMDLKRNASGFCEDYVKVGSFNQSK